MERTAVNPSDVKARSGAGVAGVDRLIEVDIAANATIDMQVVRADGMSLAHGSGAPPLSLRANAVLDDFLRRDLLEHNMAARLPPAPQLRGRTNGSKPVRWSAMWWCASIAGGGIRRALRRVAGVHNRPATLTVAPTRPTHPETNRHV